MPEKIDPKREEKKGTLNFDEQETGISSIKKPAAGTDTSIGGGVIESSQSQQPTKAQTPEQRSGVFTDLSKYKKANMAAPGQMSQAIVGKQKAEASEIGDTISKQTDKYNRQIADVSSQYQNLAQSGQDIINQAGGATSDEAVKNLQKIFSGESFQKPASIDLTQPQMLAQRFSDVAKTAGTEAGTKNLLQDVYGKKNVYTGGMKGLDTYLLQTTPESLKPIRETAQNLSSDIKSQLGTTQGNAQKTADDLAKSQKDIVDNLTALLQGGKTEAQELGATRQKAITEQLATGNITPELLDFYSSSPEGKAIIENAKATQIQTQEVDKQNRLDDLLNTVPENYRSIIMNSINTGAPPLIRIGTGPGTYQYIPLEGATDIINQYKSIQNEPINTNITGLSDTSLLQDLGTVAPSAEQLYSSDELARYNALRRLAGETTINPNIEQFDINKLLNLLK